MPSQKDFTGGEIAPLRYGRTDDPKYASSLRRMRNFYATPHGAAMNRPGTKFVAVAKAPNQVVRLVPFVFSSSDSYVLEFGAGYVRFHAKGAPVLSAGVPYELATPFTGPMLRYLKFAQSGNVLTVCYGGQAPGGATPAVHPQDIVRGIDDTHWTIGPTMVQPLTATVRNVFLSDANGALTNGPVPDATHLVKNWNVAYTLNLRSKATGAVTESAIVGKLTDPTVFTDAAETVPLAVSWSNTTAYAAGHVVVFGSTLYTALTATTGNPPDTSPTQWGRGMIFYEDKPIYFNFNNIKTNADTLVPGYSVLGVNEYRGRNGLFGLVGTCVFGSESRHLAGPRPRPGLLPAAPELQRPVRPLQHDRRPPLGRLPHLRHLLRAAPDVVPLRQLRAPVPRLARRRHHPLRLEPPRRLRLGRDRLQALVDHPAGDPRRPPHEGPRRIHKVW
jgi:hypothetical protein